MDTKYQTVSKCSEEDGYQPAESSLWLISRMPWQDCVLPYGISWRSRRQWGALEQGKERGRVALRPANNHKKDCYKTSLALTFPQSMNLGDEKITI